MDLASLERFALTHHGLVSLAHLDERDRSGARVHPELPSRSAFHRAVLSGQIELIHPGVARLLGTERTREQAIAAAVLAAPGSLASHRSAAHLWGIERPDDDPVELTSARPTSTRSLAGVVIHRQRDRDDLRPSVRSNIPTTNPLRMLCDLAAVDPARISPAVEAVIVQGYATPTALRELVHRHSRQGRTGIVALRHAVHAWPLGDKPADSILEPAMARLVDRYNLPPVQFHERVAGYEVDFLVAGTQVVLECDGWEFHVRSRDQWRRDRERDAELLAAGYATVRFTWEHVTRRAAATARRIEAVIARWAPEALPDRSARPAFRSPRR